MKTRVLLSLALIFSAVCMNVKAIEPAKDTYSYPKQGDYNLSSDWLYSRTTGTYNITKDEEGNTVPPNFLLSLADDATVASTVRGMAFWKGKLLFSSRLNGIPAIIIMNAVTGEVEKTLILNAEGFTPADLTNPCNFIVVDAGDNVMVCNVMTQPSTTSKFHIWKIDMETGNGVKLVDALESLDPDQTNLDRLDSFGVLGDVAGNASIWVASSGPSTNMYRWHVKNGVVEESPDIILMDFSIGFSSALAASGTSTCLFPVADDLVYLDGGSTYPTLMQITGDEDEGFEAKAIDGFYDLLDPTTPFPAVDDITNPEKEFGMNPNHNGFAQFSIGDDHFFAMPIMTHGVAIGIDGNAFDDTPQQSFRIYKYKDENKITREAEILWTFPAEGLATREDRLVHQGNDYFFAEVAVDVQGDEAKIYIYSGGNGIGAYTIGAGETGIKSPKAAGVGIYSADKVVKFTETVASAQIFSVTGQVIAKASNANSVTIDMPGIYVVKATAANGETVVSKVIIK